MPPYLLDDQYKLIHISLEIQKSNNLKTNTVVNVIML